MIQILMMMVSYSASYTAGYINLFLWFKHVLFRRNGLGAACNATMPSPEPVPEPVPLDTESLLSFLDSPGVVFGGAVSPETKTCKLYISQEALNMLNSPESSHMDPILAS